MARQSAQKSSSRSSKTCWCASPLMPKPSVVCSHPVLLVNAAGDWLTSVIALAVALQTSPFRRITEKAVNDSLEALRKIRVVFSRSLALRLDGDLVVDSTSQRHLRIDDPHAPVLLVLSE